ncbi:hypothetical protein BCR44DRAFT_57661 [Catenaria anguillulae PL171]|uniref:Uncharacterized protein n=1 Tax=Catenaria anguillulae PL171 TaxID=765915 RepID=A0A1Y2HIC4_9FUNG|nr:hypothetical protein BCR44DRAFT_57661 [Catenaria anguillulae PL171]
MTHQQLAIILACYVLAFNSMDRGNQLNLPTVERVMFALRAAWMRLPNPSTLSVSLPLPLTCSLLQWSRHWLSRDRYSTYSTSPNENQEFKCMVDLLVDLDPDLILIAMERDDVADGVKAKLPELDLVAAHYSYKCLVGDGVSRDAIRSTWPLEQLKAGWQTFVRLSNTLAVSACWRRGRVSSADGTCVCKEVGMVR